MRSSVYVCIAIVTLAASSAWSQENPVGDQPAQPGGQALRPGSLSDDTRVFVARILGSTEAQWRTIFAEDGKTYQPTILVMYRRAPAGSGAFQAIGPFYSRSNQRVYLDTSFFGEIESRFHGCRGKACQFPQAYVIAHEVGHHVQNLLGVLPKVRATAARQGQREPLASASRVASRLPRRRVGQPPKPAAEERRQAVFHRAR
jgi:predicted metalloprotease